MVSRLGQMNRSCIRSLEAVSARPLADQRRLSCIHRFQALNTNNLGSLFRTFPMSLMDLYIPDRLEDFHLLEQRSNRGDQNVRSWYRWAVSEHYERRQKSPFLLVLIDEVVLPAIGSRAGTIAMPTRSRTGTMNACSSAIHTESSGLRSIACAGGSYTTSRCSNTASGRTERIVIDIFSDCRHVLGKCQRRLIL